MTMGFDCLCDGREGIRCDEKACDLAGEGAPGNPNQCRVCWLRLGGRPGGGKKATAAQKLQWKGHPCLHLGAATGGQGDCLGCGGAGRKTAVLACGVHGLCTRERQAVPEGAQRLHKDALPYCLTCPDYVPAPETWSMLLTGGIGDAFALEAMLTPEERETLGEILYACPAAREIETLFRALSPHVYPRLRTHRRLPTGKTVHYSAEAVAGQVGALPPGVRDFSIAKVFPDRRPFAGSSFLAHNLAEPAPIGKPYAVVVPHSTWGRWENRNFDARDWAACLATLERHDLAGVVLCRERPGLPEHPRLIDLQGRTGILESVELLKAAQGYLGIDSALSVLAAKLFPASRIGVKSVWGHLYEHAHSYYAPRREFPFVARELRAPTWSH